MLWLVRRLLVLLWLLGLAPAAPKDLPHLVLL